MLIIDRRDGRIDATAALQQLNDWLAGPLGAVDRQRVVSDAIVITTEDGRFADAVALGRQSSPAHLSDYALGPLTGAARRMRDLTLQGETIYVWRERQPTVRAPKLQEAFWHLDSGDPAGARALYMALATPAPTSVADRVELLELRAALAQAEGDRLDALSAYTAINALQPGQRYARREGGFLLAAGGGASTAWKEAEVAERERPGTFSLLERATLEQQALGQQLRWAIQERDERIGMARFVALDRVLADLEGALRRQEAAATQASPAELLAWRDLRVHLQSDRLLALFERGRSVEAIALYEATRAEGIELMPHALAAAAGALAQERRSVEAVPLYEAALAKGGADFPVPNGIYFGLVYAYQDTGRFEQAHALLQQLEAGTPVLLRLTPEAGRPNAEYTDVLGLRGLILLYSDRPAQAQQHFAALTREAPLNPSYATGAALTERLRDHPEAAVARFEAQAADNPYDAGARAGHAEALLDAGEFAAARRVAESLAADYPDSPELRDLTRKRRAAVGARLDVDAEAATGGSTLADKEWRVDSRLSSGLISDTWRVFYDQSLGRGDTSIGRANWVRGGLGLSWQDGRWLAEGQVQQANTGPYRTSVAGRLDYRAGDAWRLSATFDGNSKEVPWKARVVGVGAREATVSAGYVVNEARRFDAQWQHLDFSDSNARDAFSLAWNERWISGPRFQLDTKLSADTSRGSLQGLPYFSPSHDASMQLSVRGQWLTWKSDDREFFQAVELSGGGYQQAGFGTGPLWSLRYEHRWNLGPKLLLRYGLVLSSHPYDGARERQHGVFMNLSLPLP